MLSSADLEKAQWAFRSGRFGAVEQTLADAYRFGALSPELLRMYGLSLVRQQKTSEALPVFQRLLDQSPGHLEALQWISILARVHGQFETSLAHAKQILSFQPNEPFAYHLLGQCYLEMRNGPEAVSAYRRATELSPEVAQFRMNLGLAYEMCGLGNLAAESFVAAARLAPEDETPYLRATFRYLDQGMLEEAAALLEAGAKRLPESAAIRMELGKVRRKKGEDDAAGAACREAIRLDPGLRRIQAQWLQEDGRFEEAQTQYERLLSDGVELGLSCYGLAQNGASEPENLLERIREVQQLRSLEPIQRMYSHYAGGRVLERLGRYGDSMEQYDEANRLGFQIHNLGQSFDPRRIQEGHDLRQAALAPVYDLEPGSRSDAPILVVGMVRSGTTLLEQILGSHPEIRAGGELSFWTTASATLASREKVTSDDLRQVAQEYLEFADRHTSQRLTDGRARFTDKMPLNYLNLGLIHQVFPKARIVHLRRDPIDTALSIYTTYLGSAFFAYRKANIVAFYREYLRVMEQWRAKLPVDRLFEVDYETLVTDCEATVRTILDFCDLPWNEACLKHERNRSQVSTPSVWQVRQPIYGTSMQKWRKFEPFLGALSELGVTKALTP